MATGFDSIRGHARVIDTLQRAVRGDTVAHAYLFAGPEGVGKELVARTFAAALVCDRRPDGPCGVCSACVRAGHGSHPDVVTVWRTRLERKSDEWVETVVQFITIDRIREVSKVARYSPVEARQRVILIREAETMNEPAANALLKTLEEPVSATVFVLLTARPHLLLPTILSRCQRVSFGALDRASIRQILTEDLPEARRVEAAKADLVAAMADGSVSAALALIDTDAIGHREEWLDRFVSLNDAAPDQVLAVAAAMAEDKARMVVVLDLLRLWVRDLLLVQSGAAAELLTNHDRAAAIASLAMRRPADRLLADLDLVTETERALRGNVNPRLAAERLLLRMAA